MTKRTTKRMTILAMAVVLALVAAACASDPHHAGSTTTAPSTVPPTTSSATTSSISPSTTAPPASGLKTIDQAALQALVDQTVRDNLIPGAVVLLRTPQGEFTAASGTTERGIEQRPDIDTHFRAASNTKSMTAAVILQLAQENRLSLQDPVSKYVPGVPNGDRITINDLLKMRSGLYNVTSSPVIATSLNDDPTRAWTPEELLAIAFAHAPHFEPGAEFEYNNTNYVLLGMIAQKVGGLPLATAFNERLFAPLGMKDTVFPETASNALPEPFSHGYMYGPSSVALEGTPEYTPEQIAAAKAGTLEPRDYTDVNHSFSFAAGGVVSTARDLATWMDALVGGRVLKPEYQKLWLDSLQVQEPDHPGGLWYGYGINRLTWGPNTIFLHGGETVGYNSSMVRDAANDMTLVVWSNLTVNLKMQPTANDLMVKVLDQIYVESPLAGVPTTAEASAFASAPCPSPNIPGVPSLDFPPTMRCGYLTVPENRTKPDSRTIRIFVLRLPALSPNPKPDPIVVLSGGPGGGGSFEFTGFYNNKLNANRDVILFDQRGTHLADPLLSCPEYDLAVNDGLGIEFSSKQQTTNQVAAVTTCHERATAAGIDVSAYNSAENAADLADLRVALGIDEWNLYGASYGSKLALVELRDHPEGIRSMVIDSVSPPNNNIAETWWSAPASSFKAIFAACAAEPACATAYPDLEADFIATVNRLDGTPVIVETHDATGAAVTVNVDAFPFLFTIISSSERSDASGVPKMIDDMAHGDADSTVQAMLALQTPPELVGLAGLGLAFTVFCSESANLASEAAALAYAKSVLPHFPERVLRVMPKQGRLFQECPAWNVPAADPSMSDPVVSEVPVLIIEGDFDAATAPEWVDLVTPGLPNSQVVKFPLTGHAVLGKSPCSIQVFTSFLDAPKQPVDGSCARSITLPFVTGGAP